jgi:hypothetical protein
MTMTTTKKLTVWAPKVAGLETSCVGEYDTIADARAKAAEYGHRKDLRMQDVVIRLGVDGKIIERCGPCR